MREGLPDPCAFYHVHSFAPRPANGEDVLGTAVYGTEFASVVARHNVYGAQFHPEKSGPDGLRPAGQLRRAVRRGGMILLPAVDIRDGKAVRLRQGYFDQETVYADDPLEAARSFVEAGARYLHVVDLDGARDGEPANLDHLGRIARDAGVPVQYGGGLRSLGSIRKALSAGAERVVVGTAAYGNAEFLEEAIATWGPRVLVAVDVRGGQVSVSGWTRETQMRPEDLIDRLQRQGAHRFVYTNADRDGMLEGVDVDEVQRISAAVRGRFIWSGGHRLARGPAHSARPEAAQPGGRDLRQGALRGPLRRGRGPGGAGRAAGLRWCSSASSRAWTSTRAGW